MSVFLENANQGLEPKTALREGTALVVTVLWEKANQDLEPKTALQLNIVPISSILHSFAYIMTRS